ncbi:unnamed protein product [Prunus armeniaca]|uniref:Uncharacterized protein n=1 Tax=Prunus armeniaca TaxID=36596 RepID=A0A6J5XNI8_PRUAR|nr:unnamed protein product [Prunus armeniaca]
MVNNSFGRARSYVQRINSRKNAESSSVLNTFFFFLLLGTQVVVSSDEEGLMVLGLLQLYWKLLGEDKFLIECQSLRTEDDSAFLREEIDTLPLRPCLPETVVDHFRG